VGAEEPIPPQAYARPRRLALASWVTVVIAAGMALAAILLFPESGGDSPPLASLALIGGLVTALTTAALYAIVRLDLRLPVGVAVSAAIAFALIGVVKFVLAPLGLYEVNAVRALDDMFGTVADPGGAQLTAAAILSLYAVGYWIAFRVGYRDPLPRHRRRRARRDRRVPVVLAGLLVVLGILVGGGLLLVGFLVLSAPRQYLEFVFSSWAGAGIALALASAATLIGAVFRMFDERPELVAEVGALVTLFWLGLAFLALYHALWVVYVLTLGSIWPLRTVTPK
jgi:hypothetical protein